MNSFNRENICIRKVGLSPNLALFVALIGIKSEASSDLGHSTQITIKYSWSFSLHRSWTCQSLVSAPGLNPLLVLGSCLISNIWHSSSFFLLGPHSFRSICFLGFPPIGSLSILCWGFYISLIFKFRHVSLFSPQFLPTTYTHFFDQLIQSYGFQ